MKNSNANMARRITKANSKQSYYTARLLVDKDLEDDCYRAYAYFRWVDDVIDVQFTTTEERIAFIQRQKELVACLYRCETFGDLTPEEDMVAHLICHDRCENSRLQSFIHNFLTVLEFDAQRRGRLISGDELDWYSSCLGRSVTDALQYFIRNGHKYPEAEHRCLAAIAAHITHMLRDFQDDISEGYINIPIEYLKANGISVAALREDQLRDWVYERVTLARQYFRIGKRYLDSLDVLRCKIAGYWYCTRFEVILDCIERDNFVLRRKYNESYKPRTFMLMAWIGISLTIKHVIQMLRSSSRPVLSDQGLD